ncbi:MAG: YcaQ family DNA glycosylase [Spirochaetia bacterium]|nr:YcaQ family DNA glycosylase [Spirochaetia bacterium]
MSAVVSLSREDAARVAFWSSFMPSTNGLDERASARSHLCRLGHVQIDTISVVERAHHHVLWSRDCRYSPRVLASLEETPRAAFEYWAHAAAYLPMEDYRFCLPRMRRIAAEGHEWFPHDGRVVQWVLDRIKAEGALRSQDFQSEGARGPWWDWKPAKAALEFLFHSGTLMVVGRPGFQKLYDLTERVLPPETDTRYPDRAEMADWYLGRAVTALGVFADCDLAYLRKDATDGLSDAVDRARERGAVLEAKVEGDEARRYWIGQGAMDSMAVPADGQTSVLIVSPFDNLIIDRRRAKRLLGLDYTVECYVPAAKRRFGYFALPVLYGHRPVGLVDCKAERKDKILRIVRSSVAMPGDRKALALRRSSLARRGDAAHAALARALDEYAAFNGCSIWEALG